MHSEETIKILQNMKKIFALIVLSLICIPNLLSQEIYESINIIETSVKDSVYYNFTISGDGYLSYNWGDSDDNFTTITVDLSGVTISKDFTFGSPKLWINCIDGNSCINEQGRIGAADGMFFNYSRTYIPAKNEDDLNAMFSQLSYLMRYSTGR